MPTDRHKTHYSTGQSHQLRHVQPASKCRYGKIGYHSEKIARKERIKQRNRGCSVTREYLCNDCKHWHLTSTDNDTYDEYGRAEKDIQKVSIRNSHVQGKRSTRKNKYKTDYISVYRKEG